MNKDIIGIKLSDGSLYPVLTMGETAGKQLKLTTARDGQTSIRLHLYRSASGTMEDAEYIDSLRLDDLNFHAMNEPTVALSVTADENGNVSAELTDSETGRSTSKTVSVPFTAKPVADESLSDISNMPDIPDFNVDIDIPEPKDISEFDVPPLTEEDLDFDIDFDSVTEKGNIIPDISNVPKAQNTSEDFSMQGSPFTDSSLYDGLSPEGKKKKGGLSIPLAICVICAVICICVLGIMFFFAPPKWMTKIVAVPAYDFNAQLIPEEQENQASPNEDIIIVSDEPIIPEQPVLVEPDEEEDSTQIRHLVKWGDTLWDLAGCYYKNPWAYHRIVKANNIKNPDFIVSGTIIIIPR